MESYDSDYPGGDDQIADGSDVVVRLPVNGDEIVVLLDVGDGAAMSVVQLPGRFCVLFDIGAVDELRAGGADDEAVVATFAVRAMTAYIDWTRTQTFGV